MANKLPPNLTTLKKTSLLFAMILLASFASASLYEVDSLKPTIKAEYDELVALTEISLTNSTGHPVILTGPSLPAGPGKLFEYVPQEFLKDGEDYTLSIAATDSVGNEKSENWVFTVKLLPVKLKLIEPQFGVSPTMTYRVVLEANRDINGCKYDDFDFSYGRMNKSFEITSAKTIKAEGFFGARTIYVRCEDSYGVRDSTSKVFNLRVDESSPLITSFSAEPSLIIEEINGDLQTTLKVQTNEPTVCKYSDKQNISYSSVNTDNINDLHDGFFQNNNESSEASYSASHQRLLGSYLGGGLNEQDYTYYVVCRNLAGLFSQPAQAGFSVNLRYPLEITVLSPLTATNSTTVSLGVKTNKQAYCFYNNKSDEITIPFSSMDKYQHIKTIFLSKEGSYTYYVSCTSLTQQQAQTSVSFLIDLTKPSIPVVNASGACPTNDGLYEAKAKWKATDNLSGISKYKYAVGSSQGATDLFDWHETSNEEETVDDLNLNNTLYVYWSVKAIDNAGNIGLIGYSTSNVLNKNSPQCSYQSNCNNSIKDGDESDKDCGGTTCPKCGLGKTCELNRDCQSGNCVNGKCTSPSDQCSNNIKDSGETDIDCGGTDCSPCGVGDDCSNKDDCESNYCKNGKCETSTCFDNVLNGYETGIDCGGGFCDGCGIGEMCYEDGDCESKSCQSGVCIEATCNDNKLNGLETATDCGGNCEKCSIGKSCNVDEDCQSDFCNPSTNYCDDASKKDSDNDGMPDVWEMQYVDCANLKINDSTDASLDSDKDGLTNLQEFEQGTNPCKKDNPAKSSWLWLLILLLILIALLLLAYFIGYPYYKKHFMKKKVVRQNFYAVQPGKQTPPQIMPSRAVPPADKEAHEKYMEKMKEKQIQRSKLFEPFGAKPEQKETIKISEKAPETKPALSEWVYLNELRKIIKPEEKDVFKGLEEIHKKSSKEDVFKELEKIAEPRVSEKIPVKTSSKGGAPITLSSQQKTILKIASREGKISMSQIRGIYSSSKHAKDVAEHLVSVGYLKPDKEGFFKWTGSKFQEPKSLKKRASQDWSSLAKKQKK